MGFQDRHYYRDSEHERLSPLQWVLGGSVPLFTFSGIRVRAHVSLLVLMVLMLLFDVQRGYPLEARATSITCLFLAVLLHEFGHCFAARRVGGFADEIMLWPLGGLALAEPPRRPWPTFVTIAAGPYVQLLLCLLCGGLIYLISRQVVPLNLLGNFAAPAMTWQSPVFYLWYFYVVNYFLLLFNILPIYPLDGGRMLQTVLWPRMGYGRALLVAAEVGMGGAILLVLMALYRNLDMLLLSVAIWSFITCYQQRAAIRAAGTWSFDDYDYQVHHQHHHLSRFAKWKARREIRREEAEQVQVDAILQKVHDQGMHSLNWREKRILKKATQRQRQHEVEDSRWQ